MDSRLQPTPLPARVLHRIPVRVLTFVSVKNHGTFIFASPLGALFHPQIPIWSLGNPQLDRILHDSFWTGLRGKQFSWQMPGPSPALKQANPPNPASFSPHLYFNLAVLESPAVLAAMNAAPLKISAESGTSHRPPVYASPFFAPTSQIFNRFEQTSSSSIRRASTRKNRPSAFGDPAQAHSPQPGRIDFYGVPPAPRPERKTSGPSRTSASFIPGLASPVAERLSPITFPELPHTIFALNRTKTQLEAAPKAPSPLPQKVAPTLRFSQNQAPAVHRQSYPAPRQHPKILASHQNQPATDQYRTSGTRTASRVHQQLPLWHRSIYRTFSGSQFANPKPITRLMNPRSQASLPGLNWENHSTYRTFSGSKFANPKPKPTSKLLIPQPQASLPGLNWENHSTYRTFSWSELANPKPTSKLLIPQPQASLPGLNWENHSNYRTFSGSELANPKPIPKLLIPQPQAGLRDGNQGQALFRRENERGSIAQRHSQNTQYIRQIHQAFQYSQGESHRKLQGLDQNLDKLFRELKQQRKNFHNILGALGHLAQEQQRHRAQRSREAQKPTSRSALHL